MDSLYNPSFILIFGAVVLALVPKKFRSTFFLVISLIGLILVWNLPAGSHIYIKFLNFDLILLKVDFLSRIFATIFALITFLGGIYAFHIKDTLQQVATLFYSASAIGATFAGDFITLFIYWELMAISSVILVWSGKKSESTNAGFRYLIVHLFGGSVLLAGIVLHILETNSTTIVWLNSRSSIANWLILVGFGLNAAIPPLNAWLPDAYPRASITGAVFLSALTTKTAVYALARVFPGWEILLILGTIMTIYGVVYALLTNDIRELLAYHIISQVGYMVAGVGIGTQLSINGSTAHAFSHILYKALLFMGAGVVLYSTGTSKLNKLGGLIKFLPLTFILYLIGGFSISSVPLFNGFISKSIIVHAALENAVELFTKYPTGDIYLIGVIGVHLMNLAMIGTFLSTTLKLPYYVWFSKESPDSQLENNPVPVNMHIGMALTAIICIIFGVKPSLLYTYLPFKMDYHPFEITHLAETLEILIATFIIFWIFKSKLKPEPVTLLDFDWFYRRPKTLIKRVLVDGVLAVFDKTDQTVVAITRRVIGFGKNPINSIYYFNPKGKSITNIEYDPNISRLSTQVIISGILLVFVITVMLVLF